MVEITHPGARADVGADPDNVGAVRAGLVATAGPARANALVSRCPQRVRR